MHNQIVAQQDGCIRVCEGTRHLFLVRPDGFSAVQEFLADFWTRQLGQLKAAAENPPADLPTHGHGERQDG